MQHRSTFLRLAREIDNMKREREKQREEIYFMSASVSAFLSDREEREMRKRFLVSRKNVHFLAGPFFSSLTILRE